ncbi:protein of unknown function [Hyphomicrobium sp. 1Nfss2.1]
MKVLTLVLSITSRSATRCCHAELPPWTTGRSRRRGTTSRRPMPVAAPSHQAVTVATVALECKYLVGNVKKVAAGAGGPGVPKSGLAYECSGIFNHTQ